jgi:hypothetical protein
MLDHRIQRAVTVVGRALQINARMRLAAKRFLKRLDQARFPNTGLANDRDDLALALTCQPPTVEHQPHFVCSPDEWEMLARADGGEMALDGCFTPHTPSRYRSRKALSGRVRQ